MSISTARQAVQRSYLERGRITTASCGPRFVQCEGAFMQNASCEFTRQSGDCNGRYPIDEVLEAVRGGGPHGANMVRVRWYGTNPVRLVPWGVGWERVSNCTADVRRLAALLMGPRPAHPAFVQCKPNVRSVAPALALGTRCSGRLALQAAARYEKIGRLRRSATQVLAAAEWDQWSFGGEADGSMRGKRKWRQIVALLDSDEES